MGEVSTWAANQWPGPQLWDLLVLLGDKSQDWQVLQEGAAGNTCPRGHHRVRNHMLQVLSVANLRLPAQEFRPQWGGSLHPLIQSSPPLCPRSRSSEFLGLHFLPSAQESK